MMRPTTWGLGILLLLGLLFLAVYLNQTYFANPRVIRELKENPDGERADLVMLVTLPSGRNLPVNYLRKDNKVYAGADGSWWRELRGSGAPVTLYIKGQEYVAKGQAIEHDEALTDRIFTELRPTAPKWVGAVLVEFDMNVMGS
jgi:hypothetical protein